MTAGDERGFGWGTIVRLGLVQAAMGSIVVLTTSTLNRVMVVELALPAALPGFLVALHYFIQVTRPRFGHGSDLGGRRTPWILGGMAVLAVGGILAAAATALMAAMPGAGIALAVLAFLMIGAGVGASGTSLLVLLAAGVTPRRRAAAATTTWLMMIAGLAVTAGVVGGLLDPFTYGRLVFITACVSALAMTVTTLAVWGVERPMHTRAAAEAEAEEASEQVDFWTALRQVARESHTRRFGVFVFISMLAYSAQDLVLEPFAGAVFALTPGESTQLGGLQHAGVLLGMIAVALVGSLTRGAGSRDRNAILIACMFFGCLGSATLLALLASAAWSGPPWPLEIAVFTLGFSNGVFAVAAIGAMMGLVSRGEARRDGMRMGVWGAAQAIAFGLGGIVGTVSIDLSRAVFESLPLSYASVFTAQATLFAIAALLALGLRRDTSSPRPAAAELATSRPTETQQGMSA